MKLKQIHELMESMEKYGLSSLKFEQDGTAVELERKISAPESAEAMHSQFSASAINPAYMAGTNLHSTNPAQAFSNIHANTAGAQVAQATDSATAIDAGNLQDNGSKKADAQDLTKEASESTTAIPEKQVDSVKAPIAGVFYAAANPKEKPFVKVGQKVNKGDILCILEAMKTMNEIESPYTGTVTQVLANNEEVVGYGQELFHISKES